LSKIHLAGDRLSGPLDQGIRSLAACPRTCCAVFCAFTEGIDISGACQRIIFPSCSALPTAQNLKDRRKPHMAFWWAFCPGGDFSLALQWIARLEGLTFATDFPNAQGPGG
jgi:hypothetical protein